MPTSLDTEPIPERLRRLRDERGMSRSQLSRATVSYDGKGLAEATVKSLEAGTNQPGLKTIEALAHALGVEPDDFPEYRLAQARARLDEREVGLDQALEHLATHVMDPAAGSGAFLEAAIAEMLSRSELLASPPTNSKAADYVLRIGTGSGKSVLVVIEAKRRPASEADVEQQLRDQLVHYAQAAGLGIADDGAIRIITQARDREIVAAALAEVTPTDTPTAGREREKQALQERAQRRSARPADAPDTKRAPRRRQGGAR